LKKTWPWKSRDYRDVISFEKLRFENAFRPHLKDKASVFKLLRFEESFRKAPCSRRLSVDGWPNRTNKAVFLNFSGVMAPCVRTNPFVINFSVRY